MKADIIPFYPSSDKTIEKSSGCYQYDSDGKEYLDFKSEKPSEELQQIIGFENGASVLLSSGSESIYLSIKMIPKLSDKKKNFIYAQSHENYPLV